MLKIVSTYARTRASQAMNTHLMSWLYLARRSDLQGAPVLIWKKKKKNKDHREAPLLPALHIWTAISGQSYFHHQEVFVAFLDSSCSLRSVFS